MASDIAISVEHLGKNYRIRHQKRRPATLLETVRQKAASPFAYLREKLRPASEEEIFWALRDVSFEVKRGEVVGIVGRNGAGKSTLLKILSRITDPTTGRAVIHGRVNALLEVGTGFHEELSGRENVYMNAALHGLRKAEIDRKFDEIVDFAGVEKFIDTPVKRYSSGMRVRLGFAVAASLEPDILVVDEVLAVGDISFQRKCLGRMEAAANSGRTVLFVSHQMPMVERLCTRALLLEGGRCVGDGDTHTMVNRYFSDAYSDRTSTDLSGRRDRSGRGDYRFIRTWLSDDEDQEVQGLKVGSGGRIHALVKRENADATSQAHVVLTVRDSGGYRLLSLESDLVGKVLSMHGTTEVVWRIPRLPVTEGDYKCDLYICGGMREAVFDYILDAFAMTVYPGDYYGTGRQQGLGLDKVYIDFDVQARPSPASS